MTVQKLVRLEEQAASKGLLLRLQVRRPVKIWTLKLVVAKYLTSTSIKILGEMKGWAYPRPNGLQLDTMQVSPTAPKGTGHLIWAATMAWALEVTPCKTARLLAIHDAEQQHKSLIRYFQRRGFVETKDVAAKPMDLPLRLIWGGAGSLMVADCEKVYENSLRLWEASSK